MSLALSLIFGVAQIGGGSFVAQRIVRRRLWVRAGSYALLLIALWFLCSGLAEVIVSGMEIARRLWGLPSSAAFALWRSHVDAALLAATLLLVLALVAYPLLQRMLRGHLLRK